MPDWRKEVESYLKDLNLDPSKEHEISEELSQHLTDKYEELLGQGVSAEEAARQTIAQIANGEFAKELGRILKPAPVHHAEDPEHRHYMSEFLQDLRTGMRYLRLNWVFTLVVVISLALGVGANTAIFQLLNAVRLRALPVKNPNELASIAILKAPHGRTGAFVGTNPQLTYPLYENLKAQQQGFSKIAAWYMQRFNLNNGGEARYALGMLVNGDFFETLGIRPQIGHLISPADDRAGCGNAGAVISDSFWHARYGGTESVLGQKIQLEGQPFEIIGVTQPEFFGVEVGRSFDVALPLCSEPVFHTDKAWSTNPIWWWLGAIGRLKPGWTIERASAQLQAISPGIFDRTTPPAFDAIEKKNYKELRVEAVSAATGVSQLRKKYETPLWLLLGISATVLLIACANLANLMVARGAARSREMAVRVALGASRSRLVRQLITESLLLAVFGAVLGILLARILSRLMISFLNTEQMQLSLGLQMDWRVLGFTAFLAILTCVIFGLMPAIQASRTEPGEVMKSNSRGNTSTRKAFQARGLLVISQISLSVVLIVGALLFIRTLRNLTTLDAGFQQSHILVAQLDFKALRIPPEQRVAYKEQLLSKIRSIPGVTSAAIVAILPLSGSAWNELISIPELTLTRQLANFNEISPGYFKTVGTRFVAGRDFDTSDQKSSPLVAIVTETFAKKFCKGHNPIGMIFHLPQEPGTPDRIYQIVGYVKDAKYVSLREEFTPIVFVAHSQTTEPDLETQIVIRSSLPLENVIGAVKTATADMNPFIVLDFKIFETLIREGLIRERLMATISGFFGFLAAILAMIGIYGVISFMVARRRNEIGIRIALGANRAAILRMIFSEAGRLVIAGLGMGAFLTLIVTKAAQALLFGMGPQDPATILAAIAALVAVAAVACFLPAQRAATLDPMQALHEE